MASMAASSLFLHNLCRYSHRTKSHNHPVMHLQPIDLKDNYLNTPAEIFVDACNYNYLILKRLH